MTNFEFQDSEMKHFLTSFCTQLVIIRTKLMMEGFQTQRLPILFPNIFFISTSKDHLISPLLRQMNYLYQIGTQGIFFKGFQRNKSCYNNSRTPGGFSYVHDQADQQGQPLFHVRLVALTYKINELPNLAPSRLLLLKAQLIMPSHARQSFITIQITSCRVLIYLKECFEFWSLFFFLCS